MQQSGDRLNKFLALHQGSSRREADDLITSGAVTINDEVASLGARVIDTDTVKVHGAAIESSTSYVYLLFNKPVGYVCSRRAQGDNPTIYELIPKEFHDLKPVGRLDKDSSGLLLLSNDGSFAFEMTHPKFYKKKVYEVTLDKSLQPLHRQMIADFGVMLDDGKSQFELERQEEGNDLSWIVTMSEGRNRQIRRTFTALGYTVATLHRTHFGDFNLNELAPGKFVTTNK